MQEAFTTNELKKKRFSAIFSPIQADYGIFKNLQFSHFFKAHAPFHYFLSSRKKKPKTLACRYTHAGVTVDLWRQSDKIFWLGRCLTDRNTDQLPH